MPGEISRRETSYAVAIAGEAWEAALAHATAADTRRWLPDGARLLVPDYLAAAVAEAVDRPLDVVPTRDGFVGYTEARCRLVERAGEALLLLPAGTVSSGATPALATPKGTRASEWLAPGGDPLSPAPAAPRLNPPLHHPPTHPRHRARRLGRLEAVEVDGGDGYFQGLLALGAPGGPAVWRSYGPRRPLFVYNTNDFGEAPPAPCEHYYILASGLLGLRMVAESGPPPGARVVVYDINPGQLEWIRFVLGHAGRAATLPELIEAFRRVCPELPLREVLPHERPNARRQEAWYGHHRRGLAECARALEWEFVECDLLRDPRPVLDRLVPTRRTFFMYLDLFVVWHVEGTAPWIEEHAGMARSLERLVRARANGEVAFLPGPTSTLLQVGVGSPFLAARQEPS